MFDGGARWEPIPGSEHEGPHKVLFEAWEVRDALAGVIASPDAFRAGAAAFADRFEHLARRFESYAQEFAEPSVVREAAAAMMALGEKVRRVRGWLGIGTRDYVAEIAREVPPAAAAADKKVDWLFTKTTVLDQAKGVVREMCATLRGFGPDVVFGAS